MFERYTNAARRVIFIARYEASQFGSSTIETEHLLLGILMEDPEIIERFAKPGETAESVRARVEQQTTRRLAVPTETDVPLSSRSKLALSMAAEEADRLIHRFITTEHLFLGLLQDKNDPTVRLLADAAISIRPARKILAKIPSEELLRRGQRPNAEMEQLLRDFSAGAGPAPAP